MTFTFAILKNRADEISSRMINVIVGFYEDWLWLDERIDKLTSEIEKIARDQGGRRPLMSVPCVGPTILTAVVTAV